MRSAEGIRSFIDGDRYDVYVVETPQKKEILLPAIRDCILDVDVEEKRMLVHVLEGLLD